MIRCQNLKLHLFQPVLFCNMNHEKISKIIVSIILSVSSIIIINDYCRNYFFYGGKIIQIRKVKITKTKQCMLVQVNDISCKLGVGTYFQPADVKAFWVGRVVVNEIFRITKFRVRKEVRSQYSKFFITDIFSSFDQT